MSFTNPVTGGQGTLVRPAIKSPNYVAGVSGWSINRDGSVEFNDLTLRGTFSGTNYTINASGEFFYGGTPAFGNLVMSFARAPGTDAFGNGYLGGSTVYDTANKLYINSFSSTFSQGTYSGAAFAVVFDTAQSSSLTNGGGGALTVTGPTRTASGFNDRVILTLLAGQQSQPTGGITPAIVLLDSAGNSAVDFTLSGTTIKTNNSGSPATWQTPSYNANWSASTTFNGTTNWAPLQYRLDAEDNVWIAGAFKAGAVAPGTSVFNLVAPYRPAAQWPLWLYRNRGGVLVMESAALTAGGNLLIIAGLGGAPAANDEYLINAKVPLGNIA